MKIALFITPSAALLATGANAEPATNNWSGMYWGGHLGVVQSQADPTNDTTQGSFFNPLNIPRIESEFSHNFSNKNLEAGVHAGFNVQNKQFVYGLEGQLTYLNHSYSFTRFDPFVVPITSGTTVRHDVESKYVTSLRARVGVTTNYGLFSLSAGPALSRIKYTFFMSESFSSRMSTATSTKNAVGYVVGADYEHDLGDGLSLRLGYSFHRFSNAGETSSTLSGRTDHFSNKLSIDMHDVKIGFSHAF